MTETASHTSQIKLLPEHLINQIAAGEVVERPASVVKELLDNSFDAVASQVTIDVEQGGVGLIRVRDNGVGIHHDDLALALTRHATSKISCMDDLRQLVSMGFRGEALPSVASISRTSILSRYFEDNHAWMIKSEGRSDHSQPEPVSHPQGTTVEVRDLFFNVPARRKYLRTERTEFYQIQQLVRHFAISHPEIAVRLSHNGRQVLNVKSDLKKDSEIRAGDICGSKFIQNSIRVDSQIQGLCLTGWLGKSEVARTMNDSQFFCLNGRCIRDKRVNHAIQQALQDKLPVGRHAVYALYLTIDPTMVDVNVHPAKTEVRFREGRAVHDFIYSALNNVMQQTLSNQPFPVADHPDVAVISPSPIRSSVSTFRSRSSNLVREVGGSYYSDLTVIKNKKEKEFSKLDKKIDQVGNILIVRKNNELLLIDIKKTTEFFCRKKIKTELGNGSLISKPLLFPRNLELDEVSINLIKTRSELLEEFGIIIHENNGWQLRQAPGLIFLKDPEHFISELLDTLQQEKEGGEVDLIDFLVKFSKTLPDAKTLLDQLEQLKVDEQKKLIRKLTEKDLENLILNE